MEMTPLFTAYWMFVAGILGACIASFAVCAAGRTAEGKSFLCGRSCCDACGHTLSALELIPVLSYLFLQGRCRHCGVHFSPKSCILEVIAALSYALLVWHYGLCWELLQMLVLTGILILITAFDLELMEIPNGLVLAGIIWRLPFLLLADNMGDTALQSLIGAFSVSLPVLLIVLAFEKITGKEAMGGGDIKLFFMLGCYIPWQQNILLLILSCVVGIVFATIYLKKNEGACFPFGPAIAFSAWLTIIIGERCIQWYLSFFML